MSNGLIGDLTQALYIRKLLRQGPYDSNDVHTLECHVLLMKFSGIAGVIIDWYGIEDFRGYAAIHRNTKHLIKFIKKSEISVCDLL